MAFFSLVLAAVPDLDPLCVCFLACVLMDADVEVGSCFVGCFCTFLQGQLLVAVSGKAYPIAHFQKLFLYLAYDVKIDFLFLYTVPGAALVLSSVSGIQDDECFSRLFFQISHGDSG